MSQKRKIQFVLSALTVLLCYCDLSILPEEAMISWMRTYNIEGWFQCIQVTSDNVYAIMGEANDEEYKTRVFILKTDQSGMEILYRTIDVYKGDANFMQHTLDGGFIIVGNIYNNISESSIYLIKIDSYGKKEWSKTFSEGNYSNCVQQTSDGGYIIAGGKNDDVYLLKTDEKGEKIWDKTFGSSEDNESGDIIQTTIDGGYIITGYSNSSLIGIGIYIIKTDSEGNQVWYKIINNNAGSSHADIKQTNDEGYIILSTCELGRQYCFYLIKIDSEGNIDWSKIFNEYGHIRGEFIQQTSDGGFLLSGRAEDDLILIKTDFNGDIMWERMPLRLPGFNIDGDGIVEANSGGYVIAGGFFNNDESNYIEGLFLMKIGE